MSRFQTSLLSVLSFALLAFVANTVARAQAAPGAAQGAAAAAAAQAQEEAQARERAIFEQLRTTQLEQDGFGGANSGRGGRGRGAAARGGRGSSMTAAQLRQLLSDGSITPEQYQQMMVERPQTSATSANLTATIDPSDPKDLIALDVWVLTIDMPRAKAADDITASLVSRANDLPTAIGSRDDVRVLIGKLTVAGVLARAREFRLTAFNGQTASVQSGGNQPQVVGTQFGGRGGGGGAAVRTNSIQYQSVGTILRLQPLVYSTGNIAVQVNYESSDQEESRNVAIAEGDDGNRVPATRIATQTIQATTRLKSGSAVLVQSDTIAEPNNETSSVRSQLIILSATILPANEE